jgi:peptide-methionine (R)-S-oxide reductase
MKTTGKDYSVEKTDEQWREELTPEQYQVLREAGTERAWTGELLDESRSGLYTCAACDAELFKSGTKFDSGCGWPSFYDSVNPDAVELIEDRSVPASRRTLYCSGVSSAFHSSSVFSTE